MQQNMMPWVRKKPRGCIASTQLQLSSWNTHTALHEARVSTLDIDGSKVDMLSGTAMAKRAQSCPGCTQHVTVSMVCPQCFSATPCRGRLHDIADLSHASVSFDVPFPNAASRANISSIVNRQACLSARICASCALPRYQVVTGHSSWCITACHNGPGAVLYQV
jgi:hypothetical protein